MEITEVSILPTKNDDRLKAHVAITLDHCFVISDLRIIRGPSGYIVTMPTTKKKDGPNVEIVSTINGQTRKIIEERVLAEYRKITGEPAKRQVLK